MKNNIFLLSILMFSASVFLYSSQKQNKNNRNLSYLAKGYSVEENIIITANGKDFIAKIYKNKTAEALLTKLPMTINMAEMNGNEKYYFMENNLPTSDERTSQIKTGEIMLYGNNCLVLFYKTFSSSYTYTRIGYIENIEGLTEALGRGSVNITIKKVQKA